MASFESRDRCGEDEQLCRLKNVYTSGVLKLLDAAQNYEAFRQIWEDIGGYDLTTHYHVGI